MSRKAVAKQAIAIIALAWITFLVLGLFVNPPWIFSGGLTVWFGFRLAAALVNRLDWIDCAERARERVVYVFSHTLWPFDRL